MTSATEVLVSLSAAIAARDEDALERVMQRAAALVAAEEVEEVILQSYLFLGFPVALEALATWREVSGAPARPREDGGSWSERGERICRAVYAGQYERLRANVQRLHPDVERWMVEEGYGKVLGRPGPDLRVRELCVAACLVVLDAPRQLYSHLRGALNVGASEDTVARALEIALPSASPAARASARETWDAVLRRARAKG